jgi:hypothetical protein
VFTLLALLLLYFETRTLRPAHPRPHAMSD